METKWKKYSNAHTFKLVKATAKNKKDYTCLKASVATLNSKDETKKKKKRFLCAFSVFYYDIVFCLARTHETSILQTTFIP